MELPEGYRAEIAEGAIEAWSTGRLSHARVVNRVRTALQRFLEGGEYATYQAMEVIFGRMGWTPDVLVAPEGLDTDEDELGLDASAVHLVIEVASPGKADQDRDRIRKRREYARAGIPVYALIDDYEAKAPSPSSPDLVPRRPTGKTSTASPTAPKSPSPKALPRAS